MITSGWTGKNSSPLTTAFSFFLFSVCILAFKNIFTLLKIISLFIKGGGVLTFIIGMDLDWTHGLWQQVLCTFQDVKKPTSIHITVCLKNKQKKKGGTNIQRRHVPGRMRAQTHFYWAQFAAIWIKIPFSVQLSRCILSICWPACTACMLILRPQWI